MRNLCYVTKGLVRIIYKKDWKMKLSAYGPSWRSKGGDRQPVTQANRERIIGKVVIRPMVEPTLLQRVFGRG
jgi:hypothetical protein